MMQHKQKISHGDIAWGEPNYTTDEVRQLQKRGEMFIAFDNKRVVATVSLADSDTRIWGDDIAPALYIHKLAVDSSFSGKKIGEKLIEWAATQAQEKGIYRLRLDCGGNVAGLCSYYERIGFIRVGTTTIESYDGPVALFEKVLG